LLYVNIAKKKSGRVRLRTSSSQRTKPLRVVCLLLILNSCQQTSAI